MNNLFSIKNKNKVIFEVHFLTDRKEINNASVRKIIERAVKQCFKEIAVYNKKIAIYSCEDTFIKNKMGGVGADTREEGVITLRIQPTEGWKDKLVHAIAHEYSHLAVEEVRVWKSVIDSLIIEGIAEVFREEIVGGGRAPWTRALSETESKKVFSRIRNDLAKKAETMHTDLFFGSKQFKMWSGYTLGYFIVKEFRKKFPRLSWREIIAMSSRDVLSKSGWSQ